MKQCCLRIWGIAVVAAIAVVMPACSSVASGILYDFKDVFAGTAPQSSPPWMTAEFQNITPGVVQLTLSNPNLSGSENAGEVYFNLNPALDPAKLQFSFVGGSGGFDMPQVLTGADQFKAGGDGKYDLKFVFANGGTAASWFGAGEYLVCDISGLPTLTASDFGFLSSPVGGTSPFYAAAHVQRIGTTSVSGWLDATTVTPLAVPEPKTAGFCLLAAALGILMRTRRGGG